MLFFSVYFKRKRISEITNGCGKETKLSSTGYGVIMYGNLF